MFLGDKREEKRVKCDMGRNGCFLLSRAVRRLGITGGMKEPSLMGNVLCWLPQTEEGELHTSGRMTRTESIMENGAWESRLLWNLKMCKSMKS